MNLINFYRLQLNVYECLDVSSFHLIENYNHRLELNKKWTNYITEFRTARPFTRETRFFDYGRLFWDFQKIQHLLRRSGLRPFSNSVLLFTNIESNYPLVVYFSEKYNQRYLLGWWCGLISNWHRLERFIHGRFARHKYNFRFRLKISIAIFVDFVTNSSLRFLIEFKTISTGTLCIGLTDTADRFVFTNLHLFTSKSFTRVYFYLLFLFKYLQPSTISRRILIGAHKYGRKNLKFVRIKQRRLALLRQRVFKLKNYQRRRANKARYKVYIKRIKVLKKQKHKLKALQILKKNSKADQKKSSVGKLAILKEKNKLHWTTFRPFSFLNTDEEYNS